MSFTASNKVQAPLIIALLLGAGSFVGCQSDDPTEPQVAATGSISVASEPSDVAAPWYLLRPSDMSVREGTGEAVMDDMPAGEYRLYWGAVSGWRSPTPNPLEAALVTGGQIAFSGTYSEIVEPTGSIAIDTNPDVIHAPWTLSGPNAFVATGNGDKVLDGREAGSYRLEFGAVPNYEAAAPVEGVLEAGGRLDLGGNYIYQAPPSDGPAVEAVSGGSAQGAPLVISGTGFGAHTLDVEWTGDWIEAQPKGTNPDTKPGWKHFLSAQGPRDHITTDRAWSGSKAIDISVDRTASPLSTESTLGFESDDYTKIYVSYWTYVNPIAFHPDVTETGIKAAYVSVDDWTGTWSPISVPTNSMQYFTNWEKAEPHRVTQALFSLWPWVDCPDITNGVHLAWEDAVGVGYDLPEALWHRPRINRGSPAGENFEQYNVSAEKWTRVELYAYAGIPDVGSGEVMYAITDPVSGDGRMIGLWATGLVMQTARTDCRSTPSPWSNFIFQYFFDDNLTRGDYEIAEFLLDDVYLQFGTRARVELGNSPVYQECTLLEIQPPTSWSSTEVVARLNRGGSFQSGDTAYVFIIREDEEASTGFPITVP